jgi:hypothetical protein
MRLPGFLATNCVEPYNDLVQKIITAQAIDVLAADMKCSIVSTLIIHISDLKRIDELEEDSSNG